MTGRKIVDRVDELLHAPEPPNNRSLHPPPLRIDTGRRLTRGSDLNVRVHTRHPGHGLTRTHLTSAVG